MVGLTGLEPTTYRLTAGCSTVELPRNTTWLRPTLPGSFPPSTIGAKELNFCVRNGNRCILLAIVTKLFLTTSIIISFVYIFVKYFGINTFKTKQHINGQVLDLLVFIS